MKRTDAFFPHGGRLPDAGIVRHAASILFDPNDFHELRGLPSGRSRLVSAADPDGLITAVTTLADDRGIYYTLNPVRSEIGDRAARVDDILRRRWLLIDLDRRKLTAPDESATFEEKDSAWAVAAKVMVRLKEDGWPDPVLIDSGNGYHLLYRVDIPNDEASRKLLVSILKQLSTDHDSDTAEIDRKVHNASRIAKLPGTWACKGTDTTERPHRMARLLDVPEQIRTVPLELLQALAKSETQAETTPPPRIERPNSKVTRPEDAREKWFRKALEGECAKVAMAPEGGRHDQLVKSAYTLGGAAPGRARSGGSGGGPSGRRPQGRPGTKRSRSGHPREFKCRCKGTEGST